MIDGSVLDRFLRNNPGFDPVHADLVSDEAVSNLNFSTDDGTPTLHELRVLQRILRLGADTEAAGNLVSEGFHSAHQIAAIPERRFMREFAGSFGGSTHKARLVHRRACETRAFVGHLVANLRGTVGSHHARSLLANNVHEPLTNYFAAIPDYQNLFGGLNYCECSSCRSIFSPAAYFTDLMRLTENFITDQNGEIPEGYTLEERRPDLFELLLNCANTNDPVPYLHIVNKVIERRLAQESNLNSGVVQAATSDTLKLETSASRIPDEYKGKLVLIDGGPGAGQIERIISYDAATLTVKIGQPWQVTPTTASHYAIFKDPYQLLATSLYPFNLPLNVPLAEIRRYLGAMGTTLDAVYSALAKPMDFGNARAGTTHTIQLREDASHVNSTMKVVLVDGTGAGQQRTISSFELTSRVATVWPDWSVIPDNTTRYQVIDSLGADRALLGLSIEMYHLLITDRTSGHSVATVYGYKEPITAGDLERVETFIKRAGITRDQLSDLLVQGLSTAELQENLPNKFYINYTKEHEPYMRIVLDNSSSQGPYYKIEGLTLTRLDRLNRFIRLAEQLGWSYSELNWALVSIHEMQTHHNDGSPAPINELTLKSLANIKRLQAQTRLDVITLCSFWYDMKNIGRGDGPDPVDMFDVIFNNPRFLQGQNPYTSVYTEDHKVPFDPSRPIEWVVNPTSQDGATHINALVRDRLRGALSVGDNDLTALGNFVGLLTTNDGSKLKLTLTNLTWLYRLTKAAAIFSMEVVDYLALLWLMYYPGQEENTPRSKALVPVLVPTIEGVLAQKEKVDWFKTSPLNVYDALYIVGGYETQFFKEGYSHGDIETLVANLSASGPAVRVTPDAFIFASIDASRSQSIFQRLVEMGFLSDIGIWLGDGAGFQVQAEKPEFLFHPESFVTDNIDSAQSFSVYSELIQVRPQVLVARMDLGGATLSETFSEHTPLDFLFAGDPDMAPKRSEVRSILLERRHSMEMAELSFLFTLTEGSFTTPLGDPNVSSDFADKPALDTVIVRDPAGGQQRTITSYTGSTRTAKLAVGWEVIPGASSYYQVVDMAFDGPVVAATIDTITLPSSASSTENAYSGMEIWITDGTGEGQRNIILNYDESERLAWLARSWSTIPDKSSYCHIQSIKDKGLVVSADSNTIQFQSTASTDPIAYSDMTVLIVQSTTLSSLEAGISPDESRRVFQELAQRSLIVPDPAGMPNPPEDPTGQQRTITSYTGQTQTANLDKAWSTVPSDTSLYQVSRVSGEGDVIWSKETTLALYEGASAQDDFYNGMSIEITSGLGVGQRNTIIDYDGFNRLAIVATPWSPQLDPSSHYVITEVVTQGFVRSAGASSIQFDLSALPKEAYYNGMRVDILPSAQLTPHFGPDTPLDFLFESYGSGQSRAFSDYSETDRVATVEPPWDVVPYQPSESGQTKKTSMYQVSRIASAGMAVGCTLTSISLDLTEASRQNGAYNGMRIAITSGSGVGQENVIITYKVTAGDDDDLVGLAIVASPWFPEPDPNSTYTIYEIVAQGTTVSADSTHIRFEPTTLLSSSDVPFLRVSIIDDPQADTKRDAVKALALQIGQNVADVIGVLDEHAERQRSTALIGLSGFLSTSPERLSATIPFGSILTNTSNYIVDLLTPVEGGEVPQSLGETIHVLSRALLLFNRFNYSVREIEAVVAMPFDFNLGELSWPQFQDLQTLQLFKRLQDDFHVQDDSLISFFYIPRSTRSATQKLKALADVTQWDPDQISALIDRLDLNYRMVPTTPVPRLGTFGYGTVAGLAALKRGFDLSGTTGLSINSLIQLADLAYQPASSHWSNYTSLTRALLTATGAKFGTSEFGPIDKETQSYLHEQRRDALVGYAIWLLNQKYSTINSPSDLYQYLLIDVEMSGCDSIPYIRQATASVQLYQQRCRMMLEPGVTDLSHIPDVWWTWISTYRVWEANRRVFLYPENYIEPTLRSGQTGTFKKLLEALQQTQISDKTVTDAYINYFQEFSSVASFAHVGSYSTRYEKLGTFATYAEGTSDGASTKYIDLDPAHSSAINDYYLDMVVEITAGPGAGQKRKIIGYEVTPGDYSSHRAYVSPDWTTEPTESEYVITGLRRADRLYLIGRTSTQPYAHYYRTLEDHRNWSPWYPITMPAGARFVTPVVAFDKLFIFWAELHTVNTTTLQNSTESQLASTPIHDTKATIKYTALNHDGSWLAPHVLTSDIVINYGEEYELDPAVRNLLIGTFDAEDFNPHNPVWQKPYPLFIPASKLKPTGSKQGLPSHPNGDNILVTYGLLGDFPRQSHPPDPTTAPSKLPEDQLKFELAAYNFAKRYNAWQHLDAGPGTPYRGQLPFIESANLDAGLSMSPLSMALAQKSSTEDQDRYVPVLNRTINTFGISPSSSYGTIADNYLSDNYALYQSKSSAQPTYTLLKTVAGTVANLLTVKNLPGSYIFDNGDEAFLVVSSDGGIMPITSTIETGWELLPLTTQNPNEPVVEWALRISTGDFTETNPSPTPASLKFYFYRLTTRAPGVLGQRLVFGGLPYLLAIEAQQTPELDFGRLKPDQSRAIQPIADTLDFNGAYGVYFWEIFFHAPFLVASILNTQQRFEAAKEWYEYIFNPTQQPDSDDPNDKDRFWRFLPFRAKTLQTLTQVLTNPAQIEAFNDNPFDPDAIARLRISAYEKAIVMRYIKNLLDWGDMLFTQNTEESVAQATNLYVMASDLLGPRPQAMGTCDTGPAKSFAAIRQEYNNNQVELGNARPGNAISIQLADTASPVQDAYAGMYITIDTGNGMEQLNYIVSYDGQTKEAVVETPWTDPPRAGTSYRVLDLVTSGNAQGGTYATIVLAESASTERNVYRGMYITIDTGDGWEALHYIYEYEGIFNSGLLVAEVRPDWETQPEAGTPYLVLNSIEAGSARPGNAISIQLADTASSVQDAYTGMYITIDTGNGMGQMNYIVSYDGQTKEAVVETPWASAPSNGTPYRVFENGIPEFLIRMENSFRAHATPGVAYSDVPFNNIDSYFCVPENSELISYWDLVKDRLFNIRNCRNIKGELSDRPYSGPSIDPHGEIGKTPQGGTGSLGQASQLEVPIPFYRFNVLLEQAMAVTSQVTQLGASLLSALEKQDAEDLALLRLSQEKVLLDSATTIKTKQVAQLDKLINSLQESKLSAQKRQEYYAGLVAEYMSEKENKNIELTKATTALTAVSGVARGAAAIAYMVPQVGSPFAMTFGGQQGGNNLTAFSTALDLAASITSLAAQLSLTMAGYDRRKSEWQLQADLAGFDQRQIESQIAANELQKEMSESDLKLHMTSIEQNSKMDDFLRKKFTNKELYQWMVAQLTTVYTQTFNLALDLARFAQRAYQFELNTNQTFLNLNYWDNLRQGLLAGEGLMLALTLMHKSYLENNSRELQIQKTISLRQLDPRKLVDLLSTGECQFDLPERIFDDDFPGHYLRKIKTVSISIPAVLAPYQNVHATLTQVSNQIVTKADANAVNFLLGGTGATQPEADSLRSRSWVNQQIAISNGVSDMGMFDLSFNDGRYLPFEGTGAVSSWRLSLPKTTNRIDFSTIADVVLHLQYTACDGGSKFRQDVTSLDAMKPYYGSGILVMAQNFSTQWYSFLHNPTSTTQQSLSFTLSNLVPQHVNDALLVGMYVQLVVPEGTNTTGSAAYVGVNLPGVPGVTFNLDSDNSYMHDFQAQPAMSGLVGTGSITFTLAATPADLKSGPVSQQHLNPQVLQNIILILLYRGEIDWGNK